MNEMACLPCALMRCVSFEMFGIFTKISYPFHWISMKDDDALNLNDAIAIYAITFHLPPSNEVLNKLK